MYALTLRTSVLTFVSFLQIMKCLSGAICLEDQEAVCWVQQSSQYPLSAGPLICQFFHRCQPSVFVTVLCEALQLQTV
jgi:hypothetical protein